MKLVTDNLEKIIDAPDGIKRLRELILQLAVQGKLVPQRPEEGIGDELYVRIAENKKALIDNGEIANPKRSRKVVDLPIPCEVPKSWRWVSLLEIADVVDPNPSHRMPKYVTEGISFVSTENFSSNDGIDLSIGKKVTAEELENQIERFVIRHGSFVLSRIGTIGKTRMLPEERTFCLSHALCVISPLHEDMSVSYLRYMVSSTYILSQAHANVKSIGVPDLGMGAIRALHIPLPPSGEQKRIVAKVDELMAWCDELDALKEKRTALRTAALKATLKSWSAEGRSLRRHSAFADAPQDAAQCGRKSGVASFLVATALQKLITSAADVKQLRDAILQLAVQGRLVEQRDSDGTAADLLQQIEKAKRADAQDRKANGERPRKTNPLPPINEDEIPFEIPANWEWVRLGNVGLSNPRNQESGKIVAGFVPMRNISASLGVDVLFEERPWGEVKSGFTHLANEDVVIAKITPCYENGKSAVIRNLPNNIGAGTTELHVFRTVGGTIDPSYVLLNFKSPEFLMTGEARMTGSAGQKRIPKDYVFGKPFPLPPLAEQQRIVAKVDELMAGCDELEGLLRTESKTAEKFAAAISQT